MNLQDYNDTLLDSAAKCVKDVIVIRATVTQMLAGIALKSGESILLTEITDGIRAEENGTPATPLFELVCVDPTATDTPDKRYSVKIGVTPALNYYHDIGDAFARIVYYMANKVKPV